MYNSHCILISCIFLLLRKNVTPLHHKKLTGSRFEVYSGHIQEISKAVEIGIAPLLVNTCDIVAGVSEEIECVAKLVFKVSKDPMLIVQPKNPQKWKDATLAALCAQSKAARRKWKESGSRQHGSIFEEKCKLRRVVRKRIRFCAAQAERSNEGRCLLPGTTAVFNYLQEREESTLNSTLRVK